MMISAVNWGEVIYYIRKRRDAAATQRLAQRLIDFGLTVISATSVRAERAAYLRLRYKISYADAYGVELTQDSPDHILVTADYGVKSAEHDIQIEFLPTKPTP